MRRKAKLLFKVLPLVLAASALGYGEASAMDAVLAASWEPAFCRTAEGRDKKECRNETPERRSATHLSLHGLWPDDLGNKAIFPCYCGEGAPVSCETNGPTDRRVRVSDQVWQRLKEVMPGTMSGLHRHEWSKHGTCYADPSAGQAADPDEYFSDAVSLVEKLDESEVGSFFRKNLGDVVTRDEIESAFDDAFGEGASERITIVCSGRGKNAMIAELQVNISGEVTPNSDLGTLILAAPTVAQSSSRRSCPGGRIIDLTAS